MFAGKLAAGNRHCFNIAVAEKERKKEIGGERERKKEGRVLLQKGPESVSFEIQPGRMRSNE